MYITWPMMIALNFAWLLAVLVMQIQGYQMAKKHMADAANSPGEGDAYFELKGEKYIVKPTTKKT